jgi:antitoxin component YwqK of YwqJK toxin-antitoxin module
MFNNKKISLSILSILIMLLSGCSAPSLGAKKVETKYYTGGQVRSTFTWTDKTGKNGIQRTFGYEGETTSSVKIANGVKNGMMTFYDAKGLVIKQTPYVNGFIDGVEKEFYPNGDKMVTYTYKGNKKNGPAFSYYASGKVHSQAIYENGKLIN